MPGNGRSHRTGFPEIEGRIDYVGVPLVWKSEEHTGRAENVSLPFIQN